MSHRTHDELIGRILDAAVANPERVNEFKRTLRTMIVPRDRTAPQSDVRSSWRSAAPADPGDDGLWDNVPV